MENFESDCNTNYPVSTFKLNNVLISFSGLPVLPWTSNVHIKLLWEDGSYQWWYRVNNKIYFEIWFLTFLEFRFPHCFRKTRKRRRVSSLPFLISPLSSQTSLTSPKRIRLVYNFELYYNNYCFTKTHKKCWFNILQGIMKWKNCRLTTGNRKEPTWRGHFARA